MYHVHFPPAMWNVHAATTRTNNAEEEWPAEQNHRLLPSEHLQTGDGSAMTRTNNAVEGWHSRMNKAIGCCHPNIYKLVTVLKGGAGAYRAQTSTRRHWCAATTTTTKIPEPRHTTGPTTGPVPIGPADDYLTELRHVVHHY